MGTVEWITLLEENIGWWCNVMLKSLRSYQVPSWPTWVSTKVPGCWRLPPSCHLVSNSFFFFFKICILMWTIFKVFIEFVAILFPFYISFLFSFFWGPWGMWDLSSLTGNWTHTPCTGRWNLNHWTPGISLILLSSHPFPHSSTHLSSLRRFWLWNFLSNRKLKSNLLEQKRVCWWQWWEKFTGRMDFTQGLQWCRCESGISPDPVSSISG